MHQEDDYSFDQIPDFLAAFPDLDAEIFAERDTETNDGFIECPFLPLRDVVLFPQMVMPLFIGRERSLLALRAATSNDENLIVAAQHDAENAEPEFDDLYVIGTEITTGRILRLPDETTSVLAQGRRRIELVEFTQLYPYIRVRARVIDEPSDWHDNTEALMRAVLTLFEKVVALNRNIPDDAYTYALNMNQPGWLADFVTSALLLPLQTRQEMLELFEPTERLQKISLILAKELNVLELEDEIHSQVQQEVDRSQREYFLREQMRVIQGELGEMDVFTQELEELEAAIEQKNLPAEVKARTDREIKRLSAMPPMSPEVGIIRTYIDWLVELPWNERSDDKLDVAHVAAILDADHYGLEKIKDRILEHIAVRQIAPDNMRGPILCFVGPPGTGKTSLGRSIATALGREFVRMSLGGVRDEAEIRGHRRTYIGAMPGRIIQAMRRVGTINPLFMLDEIDKLGMDFRGDPAAALLEVLDPEQNNTFADHYLDVDYDLSQVLFITTANYLDTIPLALLDRMEVIEFSSYLEEEKLEICKQFLVPRQMQLHGLESKGVRIEEQGLKALIRQYTRESGVRNLEREIASVCRKVARSVAEGKRYPKRVTANKVEDMLGPPRFVHEMLPDRDEVGVATGAAWTPTGGEIMFVEVNLMPGKGSLTLTGQLGEVMQESAQAALTYTRSQAESLGISDELFEQVDVHIHIPEGAVPKDGPSAGSSMTVALISAFTNRPVRRDVSMTGEITLRGRMLPIGGVREKALAARRAGIKTFVLPSKNKSDLQDIPKKLRQDIEIVLADHVDEVLDIALLDPVSKSKNDGKGRKKGKHKSEKNS
ncbi:MAG: endopeptidase La [Candidatus Promineifilaceae bacterium]|nr:endopeptidase La [Candidatus Promineifilaceae bacterium]